MIEAADNSLKRLGIDSTDLCQLHWPSSNVPIEETMGAMDKLVESGKVRYIGISNFSVEQFKQAQAAAKNRIVSHQVSYNLVDRSIERDLLPICQENDVTVVAYSPLANGLGNLKTRPGGAALAEITKATGKTEAQVALNWCLSSNNVIAIPKSDSVVRIEENCNASGWRLSQEQVRTLDRAYIG